jgi:hypothetical protein
MVQGSTAGRDLLVICGLGPLTNSTERVRIHNSVAKLDHAKREIVAARFYESPAEAIDVAEKRSEYALF